MRKAFLLLLLLAPIGFAQQQHNGYVEVPLVDVPDMVDGVPTMEQSAAVTAAFYESSAVALRRAFGAHERRGRLAVGFFDLITAAIVPLPLSDVWLHEEWHRAVLSNRGIGSFNDVYKFNIGADAIAVSHVRDEDLIRLKRDHPADQVRLQAAGIEAELMLTQRLQKNQFFRRSTAWHLPLYWIVKVSTWGYVYSGGAKDVDTDTDQSNIDDGADVKRRDFTGHDFNGWVYDLFRPHEPYEARGVHPSGVGIDRYRKSTHMTAEERAFLRRQGRLALINFADPYLFGFRGRQVAGYTVSANAAHFLTSFGYTIDANLFVREGDRNLFVTLHHYVNGQRAFPGAEAEVIDYPLVIRNRAIAVTPRIALWLQPENQLFRDSTARLGGLAAVRATLPLRGRIGSFVEVETKTRGWVAGNVHLDGNTAMRFGLTARLGVRPSV